MLDEVCPFAYGVVEAPVFGDCDIYSARVGAAGDAVCETQVEVEVGVQSSCFGIVYVVYLDEVGQDREPRGLAGVVVAGRPEEFNFGVWVADSAPVGGPAVGGCRGLLAGFDYRDGDGFDGIEGPFTCWH